MKTPSPCWLLPHICDTVHLQLEHHRAPVGTSTPLSPDSLFVSGTLCRRPMLQELCFEPFGCGFRLCAQLHLPVSLCFTCGGEPYTRTDMLCLPIQAILRTANPSCLDIIPQAELYIRTVFPQNGCLCAEFDLHLCLYAVQLQAVPLPANPPEPPQSDCTPYFHLPLYPELPPTCTYRKDTPWNARSSPCPLG